MRERPSLHTAARITVRYSCPACGLADIPVEVPARGTEDIIMWLEATVCRLGADHADRSPSCSPTSLVDVKIPYLGGGPIGAPTVQ